MPEFKVSPDYECLGASSPGHMTRSRSGMAGCTWLLRKGRLCKRGVVGLRRESVRGRSRCIDRKDPSHSRTYPTIAISGRAASQIHLYICPLYPVSFIETSFDRAVQGCLISQCGPCTRLAFGNNQHPGTEQIHFQISKSETKNHDTRSLKSVDTPTLQAYVPVLFNGFLI